MPLVANIGLVGDRNEAVLAQRAIPQALALAADDLKVDVAVNWMATDAITSSETVASFDGLWCVPASPYRSMEGALIAIRAAREWGIPFLGTCGGFQHAILEFARNGLGWGWATHAEYDGDTQASRPQWVIAPLTCALVEKGETIRFAPKSLLAEAYGVESATEDYHCRFGLNPSVSDALLGGALRATAWNERGEVRGIELVGHPFFVATLFQPERKALGAMAPPLSVAFVAAAQNAARRRQLESEVDTRVMDSNDGAH